MLPLVIGVPTKEREKDCLVLIAEEVGRWKLGLIILEDEERKLETMVAMVGEEVPYSEEGEVGGVENKSSIGLMLMAKGEECLDGWVGPGGGEVKGGGVDFGVTKRLLGDIPGENTGESGGEEFRVDGGAV
ncbi:hypothetical protein Tco_0979441 [Tanacetum coccineum]